MENAGSGPTHPGVSGAGGSVTVRREPSRIECLRVLGLGPDASLPQIKRAYRRLALRYHPDHARWLDGIYADPSRCRTMFHRVTEAYACLVRDLRVDQAGRRLERCRRCGDLEAVRTGLDGNSYCRTCLLRAEGKRALPAPPTIVVGCTAILAGLVMSAGLLAGWVSTGRGTYWWAAVGTCAAAMVALVAVCLVIQYAAPPVPRRIRSGGALRRWRRRGAR